MENGIEVFKNEQFGEVRAILINDEPWFVLKDVCVVLGIENQRNVAARLDDYEKGVHQMDTLGGKQNVTIVNESGLYNVILRSDKAEAKPFRKWVTSEVLPTIRKTGGYINDTEKLVETYFGDANIYQKGIVKALFDNAKSMQDKINHLTSEAETNKPLVDFANHVGLLATSNSNVNMQTMAKLLCDNGINIGRNRLFEILRKNKILMERNIPYQQYVDRGYFLVKESIVDKGNTTGIIQTTLVTPKGQLWVQNKIEAWMNNESEVSNG